MLLPWEFPSWKSTWPVGERPCQDKGTEFVIESIHLHGNIGQWPHENALGMGKKIKTETPDFSQTYISNNSFVLSGQASSTCHQFTSKLGWLDLQRHLESSPAAHPQRQTPLLFKLPRQPGVWLNPPRTQKKTQAMGSLQSFPGRGNTDALVWKKAH